MLEALPKAQTSQHVLRFANLTHVAAFGARKDLTIDEVTDVIAFVREDVTKELVESPFQRKAPLGSKFGQPSRFSDGDWPVFYAAIDRETAEKESTHHYGRKAAGDMLAPRPVHYSVVRCTFNGEVINLRPKLSDWPDLVSESYKFCNDLGAEAHRMDGGDITRVALSKEPLLDRCHDLLGDSVTVASAADEDGIAVLHQSRSLRSIHDLHV